MRTTVHRQTPLLPAPIEHPHSEELRTISELLDEVEGLVELVEMDLIEEGRIDRGRGRPGMSAEQVLRAAIVQQLRQWTFDELAWHLADSRSYQAFCRIGFADPVPKRSTLQENIRKISALSWEAIHRLLVWKARDEGIEKGRKVRIDSTACEADVAHSTDSGLCVDIVRVGNRLLERLPTTVDVTWSNHERRAKKRANEIRRTRKRKRRKNLYRDLLSVVGRHVEYLLSAFVALLDASPSKDKRAKKETTITDLSDLIRKAHYVTEQTRRRVFGEEKVEACDKIVSIFEEHTDILHKRGQTVFGHKLCLAVGASSLVLDITIERGNPADSTLATTMIERQQELYDRVPRQVAFDGGFASKDNLADIKSMGVSDVAFHKKRGLKVSEMVRSSWVYKKLFRFRAGVEGIISWLKRCFGLRRCRWRNGFASFQAYVRSAVVAANLLTMARHRLADSGG